MVKKIDTSNIKNFKDFLNKIKHNTELDSSNSTLKVYCLNSNLSKEELFKIIAFEYPSSEIKDDISYTCIKAGEADETTFYCYHDPENPVIFVFSITGKDKIDKAVEKLIRILPKTYYFWLPLSIFQQLKEEIMDKFSKEKIIMDSFTGVRKSPFEKSCSLRPNFKRKIIYKGKDAIETLRETEDIYGILPKKMGFEIDGKFNFSINHRNTFIINKGLPYLDYLWRIINLSLEKFGNINSVLKSVRFNKLKEKNIVDFDIFPFKIFFGNEKIKEEIEKFFEIIEEDEENEGKYCVLNPLIIEGSLFYSAMILDVNKKAIFSICGDEGVMNILPQRNCESDTISRFYERVDLNLDNKTAISKENV